MGSSSGKNAFALLTVAIVLGAAPAAQAQFVIGANFTGSSLFSPSVYVPPDTMGAIGPGHFVETLNGSFAIYDRTGALAAPRVSLDQFWSSAGITAPTSFDPRALYDPATQRYFVVSASNGGVANNRILIAVSNSSDPTASWSGYAFNSDPVAGSRWADFPTIGMNGSGIYIAANMVVPGSNFASQTMVAAIDKAGLVGGTPTPTLFVNLDPNTTGFSMQPVVDMTGGGTPERIYSAYNGSVGLLKRSDITGPGAGNVLNAVGGFITSPTFSDPSLAHQPGIDNIDAGDARFGSNVILVGGNVWAVNDVQGTMGHDAIRWYRIDPSTNVVLETGLIEDSTHDYYYGSIAVNGNGDVVIGYSRSGDDEFVSSYASTGHFNGISTSLSAPMLLKSGVATYNRVVGGSNRWGDYSATMVDPTDSSHFWTIQEFANAGNLWSTQITELYIPRGPGGGGNVPVSGAETTLIGAGLACLGWLRRRAKT